ncbi:LysR substrate-binding domain-containing protein [Phytohalomonas tamaricis]|uniref:LysR substrate-binding domain-containing protein n=1 Tax=Phytohalomonas tamaricis TaxID=2081032 RepID=UPI000D0B944C|nr:LysR substrate-binding domain-containing protein [Phytohalomonas tamaricis]
MFNPVWLQTFVTVAQTRSFTASAVQLGLGQSTVSQHVRRLEDVAGQRLFVRDTHTVTLTSSGEALLGFARTILETQEQARRHLKGSELRGRLRFGASEDFVSTRLPEVLGEFTRRHPAVDLELNVALSGQLYEQLDAGELDLVLAKRRLDDPHRGQVLRRDRLVWAARADAPIEVGKAVPLILYPRPSITREAALDALTRGGHSWRIVCTCASLSGLHAAALAGLGIMVQPRSLMSRGLVDISTHADLPELEEVEFVLTGRGPALGGIADELAMAIRHNDRRLQPD